VKSEERVPHSLTYLRLNMDIDEIMRQPLEDLVSLYYELVASFDELEDAELFEVAKVVEVLEDYLIHMKII